MTITELYTKRDEIIQSLGVVRQQSGDKSIEYGQQIEALAAVNREILRAGGSNAGTSCTFGTFSKG